MCHFARDVPTGVHVHDYRRDRREGVREGGGGRGEEGGGRREGEGGGGREGGDGGREKVREGGTGEKERKEERGIRAKKDGTQTK